MATLPPFFVESTLQAAKEHGLEAHPLPENQGLLLFADGVAVSEQCLLLQKLAAELQHGQGAPPAKAPQPENSQSPAAPSTIDCQVSVEERAQLFKFLTG